MVSKGVATLRVTSESAMPMVLVPTSRPSSLALFARSGGRSSIDMTEFIFTSDTPHTFRHATCAASRARSRRKALSHGGEGILMTGLTHFPLSPCGRGWPPGAAARGVLYDCQLAQPSYSRAVSQHETRYAHHLVRPFLFPHRYGQIEHPHRSIPHRKPDLPGLGPNHSADREGRDPCGADPWP